MSLKLTTSLSQRLVLTPQLRQRIEMLQMTSLELTDLIQQQLLENPVLEEVPSQEEVREIAGEALPAMFSRAVDARRGDVPDGRDGPQVLARLEPRAEHAHRQRPRDREQVGGQRGRRRGPGGS